MIEIITVSGEAIAFILFVISGTLSGFLYEFIRVLRYNYSKTNLSDSIFDITSSVCLFLFIIFSFVSINNLDIKLYCFAGIIAGIILYFVYSAI